MDHCAVCHFPFGRNHQCYRFVDRHGQVVYSNVCVPCMERRQSRYTRAQWVDYFENNRPRRRSGVAVSVGGVTVAVDSSPRRSMSPGYDRSRSPRRSMSGSRGRSRSPGRW